MESTKQDSPRRPNFWRQITLRYAWISAAERKLDFLFPKVAVEARNLSGRAAWIVFISLAVVFSVMGSLARPNGFVGFDWFYFFGPGHVPAFYPPWDQFVTLLGWPLMCGLSLAALCLAIIRRAVHPVSAACALLALPVLWTLFLGQLEGLVILGLLALPWLTPLALLKPQISFFAFGARKSYLVGAVIWIVVSLLVWGFWPQRMFAFASYYPEGRYPQDIAIGWAGLVLAVPLFWYSRGDMDMLMLSGAFATPHLIPYNLMPLTPAIARLKPLPALLIFILSWIPLSANWLGPSGWWLGWLFVGGLWITLAHQRHAATVHAARPNKPA